jgi:hypothetical protein
VFATPPFALPQVKAYLNGTNLRQFLTFRALIVKVVI